MSCQRTQTGCRSVWCRMSIRLLLFCAVIVVAGILLANVLAAKADAWEFCRPVVNWSQPVAKLEAAAGSSSTREITFTSSTTPVSYTHMTLPTISPV